MEVAANFPDECRYVLEMLGQVYGYDAEARVQAIILSLNTPGCEL